ncbi:kinase-like protein [Heliocybe sulcata]|uniref:Kinase-like protein n=1 Tax=Heliocybe sulcata TaxID=5364 RepID=A0A5C3NIG8_9AGAM|nr:kinase-like protein [Heliocybe sulcata]
MQLQIALESDKVLVSHGPDINFDLLKTRTFSQHGSEVAMKRFRSGLDDTDTRKHRASLFNHLVEQWQSLKHPNIYPVHGIYGADSPELSIIMPFSQEGNILKYLSTQPSADKFRLVQDFAMGLAYIHSRCIAHGNVRPENVLIYRGRACITDICISASLQLAVLQESNRVTIPDGWAYKPLEELTAVDAGGTLAPTQARDVFPFAHSVYHIYTGRPFWDPKRLTARLLSQPGAENMSQYPRPDDIPAHVWSVLQRCWSQNITMDKVVRKLQDS